MSILEHSYRSESQFSETTPAIARRELSCLSRSQIPSEECELSSLKQSLLLASSDLSVLSSPDIILMDTRSDTDPLLDRSPPILELASYPVYSISVPPFESPRMSSSADDSPRVVDMVNNCFSASLVDSCSTSTAHTLNRTPIPVNSTHSTTRSDRNPTLIGNNETLTNHLPFPSNCIYASFRHP